MGKLTMVSSGLTTVRSSTVYVPQGQREQDQQRARSNAWRAWYNTPEWRRLRIEVFVRDAYTCQATGVLLTGKHPEPNSPVADHKVPHRGDRALFFDPANVWTLSKAYHDREKQRAEQPREMR